MSEEADVRGKAGGVMDWTRCAFTQGSNNTAEVRGSYQETAPTNTAENTAKHRDGGVGSVVANHRGGGESSVVVTTLGDMCLDTVVLVRSGHKVIHSHMQTVLTLSVLLSIYLATQLFLFCFKMTTPCQFTT